MREYEPRPELSLRQTLPHGTCRVSGVSKVRQRHQIHTIAIRFYLSYVYGHGHMYVREVKCEYCFVKALLVTFDSMMYWVVC